MEVFGPIFVFLSILIIYYTVRYGVIRDRIRNPKSAQWVSGFITAIIYVVVCYTIVSILQNPTKTTLSKFNPQQLFQKTANLPEIVSPMPRIHGRIAMLDIKSKDTSINTIEFLKLPKKLRANSMDDAETVILLRWDTINVGKYTSGEAARKIICEISVCDLTTNTIIAKKHFQGGEPSEYITHSPIATSGSRIGSRPTREIVNYVKSLSDMKD